MHSSVVPNQPTGWLSWGRLVAITLAVMLVGVIAGLLIIGRLGLFAPPLLPYTVPFYLLLWLPVFVIGLFFRPHGSRRPLLVFVVLGLVIVVMGLVILGPTFNYTNGTCQSAPLPETPVRYACSLPTYQNSLFNYILEGREGSPFVQPVPPNQPAAGG
ncbi:MAG: hypothetical protein JNJ61_09780 [Anaerolineae bacterium]|nr:hypothetical protein [Anaerolineae bacterium]